ncbi:hypothetical protein ZYGR_0K00830 [Zygosaccharomyces rouxii]|uniref:non-specific serine/threonine protein kinase n=1 Tax=Zygosaccharomyces rouxii TaxID=4956 RepID=A0A1Q2ZYT4_ZYGRO|nr:hypothetical protein ZYGR_0K00830 [Zygosaccharomyces rouxii]
MSENPYRSLDPSNTYTIQQCVGRGNFGDVYKACDKTEGKIVAVKVVNLEHSEEDIDLLAQEIFFLAELRSPFITNYITTLTEDVSMWIVMEYCGGGSCADLIKHVYISGMPEKKVAFVTSQVLKGLVYLHEQKKIHRDIKAANILLTDEGKVKLGDFGVSGQIRATLKRGTFVGTPYWMAPEVVCKENDGYDEKADIWSLGITVYELLKGAPPLSKCDPMKVMINLPKRKPPTLHGHYSHSAKNFVSSCLVKNPVGRASAYEMVEHSFVNQLVISDLKEDVEYLKIKKSNDNYSRSPKYSLENRLYDGSASNFTWDFETMRSMRKPNLGSALLSTAQLTPDPSPSPLSSNMHSPYRQTEGITPITHATTPSFRQYNNKDNNYDVESPMEIDLDSSSMAEEIRTKGLDYYKNVIFHCFRRMHDRAHDNETKVYVNEMLKNFALTESKVSGFSEVFIEEVALRLDSIKNFLAK